MYCVVFASAPCTVEMSTAADASQNVQTFNVSEGAHPISIPLTPQGGMSARMIRNGESVVELDADGYTFQENFSTYDFNPVVKCAPSC